LLQNPYLFHTSVLSNVLWGLQVRGVPRRTGKKAAQAALETVGLLVLKTAMRAPSRGVKPRGALAPRTGAGTRGPLLDEPANIWTERACQRTGETVLN